MSEANIPYYALLIIWIGIICVGYLVDYVYGRYVPRSAGAQNRAGKHCWPAFFE